MFICQLDLKGAQKNHYSFIHSSIHAFIHSFTYSTNFCCSRHQRQSNEEIQQRTCSLCLFSRILIKRQSLLGRLPRCTGMGAPDSTLFFLWETLYILTKSPCSYIRVNKFFMCLLPPHSPHSLPCRLLQESLEKNVNDYIFISI